MITKSATWSLSTLMLVLVSDAIAPHEQGRVLGALHLLWNLAMVLSVLVGGLLVEVRAGLPFAVASYFARQGVTLAYED